MTSPGKPANSAGPHKAHGARERYINRELSWLAFNSRVLEEAFNPHNPLLERLNFLSISASNLDEFFMVRVAGLKDQIRYGVSSLSIDGLTPAEQLARINERTSRLIADQQQCWRTMKQELKRQGIAVAESADLHKQDIAWLEPYFLENIFPVLTPIAIDLAHPFPFLPNLGIAQLFRMRQGKKSKKDQLAVIPFPSALSRFIRLPDPPEGRAAPGQRFVKLEDVVELFFSAFFPGCEKQDAALIRAVRDSDLDIEEEADNLVRHFERAIKERKRGRIIRVKARAPVSGGLLSLIADHLPVGKEDIELVDGLLGAANLRELYDACDRPDLKYAPHEARFPERIDDFGGDCFAAIAAKDIVVHHPFESFDVVVRFLQQAAADPDVVSIKQTLYRTSKNSPIVRALIEAAEAGKSVTAAVELKARFDEEANIRWARDLERAGVQVVYGFVHLKTHAKVSLVVRKTEGQMKSYVHFGTGNYHPLTARVYTDLSFFTCDPVLCRDAAYFFNFITGNAPPRGMKKLAVAPHDMRGQLLKLIGGEAARAEAGGQGTIWAKMNAVVDKEIIDALYDASRKGAKITLVVRGICCLRPGVKGLSENIAVKSIVGRFLEHSRIFCFGAGHALPSPLAKVFISSGDWMPRNLSGRVEVMVPIENPTVHAQILDQIMAANLMDEKQSWLLKSDGSYARVPWREEGFCAHEYFMHNPSLSGRGKALKKGKQPKSPKAEAPALKKPEKK